MELREELDFILNFISEASLTDAEFIKAKELLGLSISTIVDDDIQPKDKYKALCAILNDRSGEGGAITKLTGYFIAKGYVDIDGKAAEREFNNFTIMTPFRAE